MSSTHAITTCTVCGGLLQRRRRANGEFWTAVSVREPYSNRCQAACSPDPAGLPPALVGYTLYALSLYGVADTPHRTNLQRRVWRLRLHVRAWRFRE